MLRAGFRLAAADARVFTMGSFVLAGFALACFAPLVLIRLAVVVVEVPGGAGHIFLLKEPGGTAIFVVTGTTLAFAFTGGCGPVSTA